ncbi:hypothetical protein HNP55_003915 [Paucibacter oligotrophus]|uniref:Lipoprotein n=1 Tax=Roseateles oligotrophus TaxID=1769250 RepID=A0A840LEF8_9BURK|nr:hypothetical protein [Roseateles oligotrophus]MBB4845365.1 hypothetical protein [Roseateles oligotrophus]
MTQPISFLRPSATPRRSGPSRLAVLLPSLMLAACALPPSSRMAAPADIAPQALVLDVAHRSRATGLLIDESFELGPYRIGKVKRGLSSNSSWGIDKVSSAQGSEHFSYGFQGQQEWQGHCELRSKGLYLQLKQGRLEDEKSQLQCSCQSAAEQVQLKLDDEWRPLQGEMVLGQTRYAMRQYLWGNSDGGLRSPAVGYRVEQMGGQKGVAAVEVLYPGRVWQLHSLPKEQGEPMACLLSGLMIYGSR